VSFERPKEKHPKNVISVLHLKSNRRIFAKISAKMIVNLLKEVCLSLDKANLPYL